MLSPSRLLAVIAELNNEIENGIDGLSTIESLTLVSNGTEMQIRLFGGVYWTDEEEEIDGKIDLINILMHRLKAHKVQVDSMLNMWVK